jgi:BirA family transcriptional regulator, biotin operon repressor / biotin---[acetyl-CoA-carboxylase] ligase
MKITPNNPLVIRLESIDSTNNYARQLLENQKPPEGTVIFTRNQYSGRGQGSNYWESEPDKNLTFTIIHYPEFLRIEEQILLNKALALAIADFIKSIDIKLNVKIKWPNDIYLDDNKVAGMLIENTISGNKYISAISGIGININQSVFKSDAPNPTSLKIETGQEFEIDDCLHSLIKHINIRYQQLKDADKERINSDYLNNLFRLEKYYRYKYKDIIITAKLTGITEFGRLILATEEGIKIECDVKEVEFII